MILRKMLPLMLAVSLTFAAPPIFAAKLVGGCALIVPLMSAPGARPQVPWVWRGQEGLDPAKTYRALLTYLDVSGRDLGIDIRERGRDVFMQVAREVEGVAGVSMHNDGKGGFWTLTLFDDDAAIDAFRDLPGGAHADLVRAIRSHPGAGTLNSSGAFHRWDVTGVGARPDWATVLLLKPDET